MRMERKKASLFAAISALPCSGSTIYSAGSACTLSAIKGRRRGEPLIRSQDSKNVQSKDGQGGTVQL